MADTFLDPKKTAVYCRQSTLIQVERNRESTLRQYDLVSRAGALGWPRSAIHVIDADLGVSGSGLAARAGFTELTEQIALGQVGVDHLDRGARPAQRGRLAGQRVLAPGRLGVLADLGHRGLAQVD